MSTRPFNSPREASSTEKIQEDFATHLANTFAGQGWIEVAEIAGLMECSQSQLTQALRWIRAESKKYVVETKVRRDSVVVRVTEFRDDEKRLRQLSAELLPQLVKIYVHLKGSKRSRAKLAKDVEAIACRIAPFVGDDFHNQCGNILQRANLSEGKPSEADIVEDLLPMVPPRTAQTKHGVRAKLGVPMKKVEYAETLAVAGERNEYTTDRARRQRLVRISGLLPTRFPVFIWFLIAGLLIAAVLGMCLSRASDLITRYIDRLDTAGVVEHPKS